MINEVRNTVMAVLNKDNNGYVTPEEFNLFARQAQLELFEEYFYDYSRSVVLRNARKHNSGYGNIPKQTAEVIDTFTLTSVGLTYDAPTTSFTLPTDWYTINTVFYTPGTSSIEVEQVRQSKIHKLVKSNLTAPNTSYPAYYITGASLTSATPATPGNSIKVYPTSIIADIDVEYVRYPKSPKWTYNTVGGSPLFNIAAADYQDFELPDSDQSTLVLKILQLAGINIREPEVVQYAMNEETIEDQKEG